jgi:hypothetical protein
MGMIHRRTSSFLELIEDKHRPISVLALLLFLVQSW